MVVTALLAVVVGGYLLTQHLSAPGDAPAAAPRRSALPTPAAPPAPTSSPAAGSAAPLAPAPWASLQRGEPLHVGYASSRAVRSEGVTFPLDVGVRVITMDRAARGPVLLVQDRGTTALEQLRADGSRRVLDAFPDDGRHPQGVAVDPAGRLVAYGLTSADPDGPFGLVVRDLYTGTVVASRRTRLPFAVRDWTPGGVLLEVTLDAGGPPYAWHPGRALDRVTPGRSDGGPRLLASAPHRPRWAISDAGCTAVVTRLGEPADLQFCRPDLSAPAAWSPSSSRIAARSGRRGVAVLDLRTGRATRLRVPPQVFVRQVGWERGAVLLAVNTLDGDQGAVLRCRVGDACRQVRLGRVGSRVGLVLAR